LFGIRIKRNFVAYFNNKGNMNTFQNRVTAFNAFLVAITETATNEKASYHKLTAEGLADIIRKEYEAISYETQNAICEYVCLFNNGTDASNLVSVYENDLTRLTRSIILISGIKPNRD
jgi:hypothetical protein